MEVAVRWVGQPADELQSPMTFLATGETGHSLLMDGAPPAPGESLGGRNLAPRPMEVVLMGTGGCTAYDVVMILKRGRHAVEDVEVRLAATRADSDPKVFTAIHFHFIVVGQNLRPDVVERAIELSHEKYCSASVMLAKTATLSYTFEIRSSQSGAAPL